MSYRGFSKEYIHQKRIHVHVVVSRGFVLLSLLILVLHVVGQVKVIAENVDVRVRRSAIPKVVWSDLLPEPGMT